MENKTNESGGLGRAFVAIGLIIILLSLFLGPAWWGIFFGLILVVVGIINGGCIQK